MSLEEVCGLFEYILVLDAINGCSVLSLYFEFKVFLVSKTSTNEVMNYSIKIYTF